MGEGAGHDPRYVHIAEALSRLLDPAALEKRAALGSDQALPRVLDPRQGDPV